MKRYRLLSEIRLCVDDGDDVVVPAGVVVYAIDEGPLTRLEDSDKKQVAYIEGENLYYMTGKSEDGIPRLVSLNGAPLASECLVEVTS